MTGTTSSIISNLLSSLERLSQFMPTFSLLAASSSSSIAHVTPTKVNSDQEGLIVDLSRLSRMLQRIQAALNYDKERKINEKFIQLWLNELREVANDAEDVFDQYDYKVIITQLEGMTAVAEAEPFLKGKQVDDDEEEDDIYGYQDFDNSSFNEESIFNRYFHVRSEEFYNNYFNEEYNDNCFDEILIRSYILEEPISEVLLLSYK